MDRIQRALVTGITGQDGSYLAELLLEKGYEVHGLIRRSSTPNCERIAHLIPAVGDENPRLHLHHGDLGDSTGLQRVVAAADPDEVYNLAGQSNVAISFDQPEYTANIVATGTLRLLDAVRAHCQARSKTIRFFQASSSEMYGNSPGPHRETTPFAPCSPYAVSKLAAHGYCATYREAYNLFICSGILFNHESPRRGEQFVTRKVTRAAARIKLGLQEKLYIGNLDASRDWGYAPEYVEAMWLMLQQERPADYVIATGVTRTVREFIEATFEALDLDWRAHVELHDRYRRPTEVATLLGDAAAAQETLGWRPRTSFAELVAIMTDHDLTLARRELAVDMITREPGPP